MKAAIGDDEKLKLLVQGTQYAYLPTLAQEQLAQLALKWHFTHQELKKAIEYEIDLKMWGGDSFIKLWTEAEGSWQREHPFLDQNFKKWAFNQITTYYLNYKTQPRKYQGFLSQFKRTEVKKIESRQTSPREKILGLCPVHSEKTLCCKLLTIDAVKNCALGCSYCSIQTMFSNENILFDKDFSTKVQSIQFDPERKYHVGTGQSSDALLWGNREGILDVLCDLAKRNSNILLEFKTKSKNVNYFLEERSLPENIVCSWSLNPELIIASEEHLAATLAERLAAAQLVAQRGVKVAFHFHPIFYYETWQQDYSFVVEQVMQNFSPHQVLFISFGAMTIPKSVVQMIRRYPYHTKVLQMAESLNPEGKVTYTPEVKTEIFTSLYSSFKNWHKEVFFYLCMEERNFWQSAFGYSYANNEEFENELLKSAFSKIVSSRAFR